MRHLRLICLLISFLTFATAFPWPDAASFEGSEGSLMRRQDGEDRPNSSDSSASATDDPSSTSASSSRSRSASASASDESSSRSASGSDRSTQRGSKTTTKAPKTTDFDPRLPAGGVSMITPAAISGPQYYKIGEWVTFAWNYTSLSVPPKNVDILATCSANQATYTLAANHSFEQTQKVLWDTGAYQKTATVPLLTETYTLVVYDADSSISATPKSGYLGVFNQWTFGMYKPQDYTPLSSYQCATCNGAMSSVERQTLAFLFGMGSITVLTFTWFANSFGLF